MNRSSFIVLAIIFSMSALCDQQDTDEDSEQHTMTTGSPVDAVPDLREQDLPLKLESKKKDKNWFVVPIPMSSPTLGTGLILGGAYYYPQTEAQKQSQPASFTGATGGYTANKSWFTGVMHQSYFGGDKWRINALAAYADFRLELVPPAEGSDESVLDWLVSGYMGKVSVQRQIKGDWYAGVGLHYLDIRQDLDLNTETPGFNPDGQIQSPGIGLQLEYDSRDLPMNPSQGQRLELRAVFADQQHKQNGSYDSYHARLRSYHQLSNPLVLAWDVQACWKEGRIPLWATCRLTLRGFAVTEYLSKQNAQAQAELRWRFHKRWGAVAFAGAGRVRDSLGGHGEDETIPSYGVGLRWMVLESQRINARVDYARSNNGNSAWYLSVVEAF